MTDEPWAVIAPLIPTQQPGPGRKRHPDRHTLTGILHVLKTGGKSDMGENTCVHRVEVLVTPQPAGVEPTGSRTAVPGG